MLKEKNDMIQRMKEEIYLMKDKTNNMIMNEETLSVSSDTDCEGNRHKKLLLQEQRTEQAFLENKAAEKKTRQSLKKKSQDYIEPSSDEEDFEMDNVSNVSTDGDNLLRVGSVETLTRKVKRELELSDKLDKSLLNQHWYERKVTIKYLMHIYL